MAEVYMKTIKVPGSSDRFHPLPIIDNNTDEGKILQVTTGEWDKVEPEFVIPQELEVIQPIPGIDYQQLINTIGLLKGNGNGNITTATPMEDYVPPQGGAMKGSLIAYPNNNASVGQMRNIIFSTAEPLNSEGKNGDVWIVYSE